MPGKINEQGVVGGQAHELVECAQNISPGSLTVGQFHNMEAIAGFENAAQGFGIGTGGTELWPVGSSVVANADDQCVVVQVRGRGLASGIQRRCALFRSVTA